MTHRSAFERFDLDPRASVAEITERLRELAEAASPEARAEIRAAWEELTMHPLRRWNAALDSHPAGRRQGLPPPRRIKREPDGGPLDLADLIPRPRIAAQLSAATPEERRALGPRRDPSIP